MFAHALDENACADRDAAALLDAPAHGENQIRRDELVLVRTALSRAAHCRGLAFGDAPAARQNGDEPSRRR
jgi:hypothetical protein